MSLMEKKVTMEMMMMDRMMVLHHLMRCLTQSQCQLPMKLSLDHRRPLSASFPLKDPCDPIQDASEEEGCIVEASQASIDFLIAEEEESAMDEKDKAQYREFLNSQDSSLVPDLLADAAVAAGGLGENVEKEKTEKEIAEDKKLPLPMEEIPVKSKDLRSSCSSKVVDNGGGGSYRKLIAQQTSRFLLVPLV